MNINQAFQAFIAWTDAFFGHSFVQIFVSVVVSVRVAVYVIRLESSEREQALLRALMHELESNAAIITNIVDTQYGIGEFEEVEFPPLPPTSAKRLSSVLWENTLSTMPSTLLRDGETYLALLTLYDWYARINEAMNEKASVEKSDLPDGRKRSEIWSWATKIYLDSHDALLGTNRMVNALSAMLKPRYGPIRNPQNSKNKERYELEEEEAAWRERVWSEINERKAARKEAQKIDVSAGAATRPPPAPLPQQR